MAFNINMSDPRLQKAQLRLAGNPLSTLGDQENLRANFVGQQQGLFNTLTNQETQKRNFESSMGLARGRLDLNRKAGDFKHKMNQQSIHDARQEGFRTTLLGLGTAGFGLWEGRRRANLLREDAELAKKRHKEIVDAIGGKV